MNRRLRKALEGLLDPDLERRRLFITVFLAGCRSAGQAGAGIGALAGAGIGQLAGGSTEATLIGAAIGGGAGYMIGNEQDKKHQTKRTQAEVAYVRDEMNYVTVNMTNSKNRNRETVKCKSDTQQR